MEWFSDMAWLVGEWFLLLALSALVGLGIGWLAWRRRPSSGQRVRTEAAATIDLTRASKSATEREIIDLTVLTSERDALRFQRDRLRSQLKEIEAMVGDEETRRRRNGAQ